MAHHTLKDSHRKLAERLNRFPQGAPPTGLLFQILRVLFSEEEAGLVALLPVRPFTAAHAARIWNRSEAASLQVMERLADRGMLLDMAHPDQHLVFDQQAHLHHRAMAAILGVILKLPPLKQVMASRQMKSRYLERLLARKDPVHRA
jgi:hypothetical protein